MYVLNCRIKNETIKDRNYLSIDVSDGLPAFKGFLIKLSVGSISALCLFDRLSNQKTVLKIGINDTFSDGILTCSSNTAEIIIKLVDYCIAGKAFSGYHFDYETSNRVNVTFWLKRNK